MFGRDIVQIELAQTAPGLELQRLDPLDRVNMLYQMGEDRRLVPWASANLQHVGRIVLHQQLGHPRHHVRLRDGLAVADGQGGIIPGLVRHGLVHEQLARHFRDRRQHAKIANILCNELI